MKTVKHNCGMLLYQGGTDVYSFHSDFPVQTCPHCGQELDEELSDGEGYPVLWASRHPLDPEAEEALRQEFGRDAIVLSKEILWPVEKDECCNLALQLITHYTVVAGVWPAQAWEAFFEVMFDEGPSFARLLSPVSVPVQEVDGTKVRRFKFVRWVII